MKYLLAPVLGAFTLCQIAQAAPLAGCYPLDPAGTWTELLLNGQPGQVGNEISAWDGATYSFSGAKIAEVNPDPTGEWDWITRYEGGSLVLSNYEGAEWFMPCDAATETTVSLPEVIVKTRSTRYPTNYLEFVLEAQSGPYSISASFAGVPRIAPVGADVLTGGRLSSAEICVGQRVRMNVVQSSLNLKSKGVIPVIIYGSANFNVADLDPASIKLECAPALRSVVAKVNSDRYPDLVLKFSTPDVAQNLMDIPDKTVTALILTAALEDGTPIAATDRVRILNKGKTAKPAPPVNLPGQGKAIGRK